MQWSRKEVSLAWTMVDGLNQQVGDQTDGLSGRLEIREQEGVFKMAPLLPAWEGSVAPTSLGLISPITHCTQHSTPQRACEREIQMLGTNGQTLSIRESVRY